MNRLGQNLLMVLVLGAWLGCGATVPAESESPAAASAPSVESIDSAVPATPAEEPVSKQFLMKTSLGEIVLELDYAKAPKTCANFESYVAKGHYNGTVFHRVIGTFMIQGGGMDSLMTEKPTDKAIENEAANGLKNARGTVAMARTNAVHSATSQFFINVVDNDFLNHRSEDPQGFGYCVFGQVVKGMETVDAIKAVPTGTRGMYRDVPENPVVIESITLLP